MPIGMQVECLRSRVGKLLVEVLPWPVDVHATTRVGNQRKLLANWKATAPVDRLDTGDGSTQVTGCIGVCVFKR